MLKRWNSEMLKYWNSKILKCLDTEIQKVWNATFDMWNTEMLKIGAIFPNTGESAQVNFQQYRSGMIYWKAKML